MLTKAGQNPPSLADRINESPAMAAFAWPERARESTMLEAAVALKSPGTRLFMLLHVCLVPTNYRFLLNSRGLLRSGPPTKPRSIVENDEVQSVDESKAHPRALEAILP